ncbi:hypothetical protein TNCV_4896111 [Trichonephila clavipes]|uniref:Uncharacterized protein n=1 Tax=Trichonephila clavipes TaxID=2585209 RepID=A0A8X6VWT8_TRICX|nr:hypothetical protein TNCV_4896111 [Trichonephila clavipes]
MPIDGELEVLLHFRANPFKLYGRITSLVFSHWRVYRFAPGTLHCSPTLLLRGNNRPTRLIPTTKHTRVQHLEAITCLVTFSLRMCLCLAFSTVLSIQVGCVPYV